MKKTAVEQLAIYLKGITSLNCDEVIAKAKEMEKEQISNAWLNSLTKGDYNSADEYYNETFKQQEE